MKMTREQLRAIGYAPDGNGGFAKVPDGAEAPPSLPQPKLNNCERRWHATLQARHPNAITIPQFRLRVGRFDAPSPVHYTADFAIWFQAGNMPDFWACVLWEVKDKRRGGHSDELTRPKLCRENNPFVSAVFLALWDGKEWEERKLA